MCNLNKVGGGEEKKKKTVKVYKQEWVEQVYAIGGK